FLCVVRPLCFELFVFSSLTSLLCVSPRFPYTSLFRSRAARGRARFGYLVALLAVDPAEAGEEEDVVVGRGGEHRLHIVLLARGHGADALAAAALGAVLGGGQALYIAAVRERVDALLLLDEVL